MLSTDERKRLAELPRDDWGLRKQEPSEQQAHTAIIMRCSRLWQDGLRIVLPPIAGRTR